jgi:superfamily II DNA or RNA helicase
VSYDTRDFNPYTHKYATTRRTMVDRNARFPPGALPLFVGLAESEGHEVVVDDRRVAPTQEPDTSVWAQFPEDLTPFAFQELACTTALDKTMGMISVDVGGGKTLIAAMLVAAVGIRWVILVHRENLVADLSAAFTKIGIEHVTHTSKKRRVADVTIATYSSCKKPEHARALMSGAQGVICDEAHTASANTHAAVLGYGMDLFYRFGLSGTPLARSDARSIVAVGHLGDIIFRIKPQELVDLGRVVQADVRMVHFDHQPPKKTEYTAIYREVIVKNKRRNQLLLDVIRAAKKPCMVFVNIKEHLVDLYDLVSSDMPNVTYAWGDTVASLRKDVVEAVNSGDIDVLIASSVFNEGVNIPNLQSVVLAAAGRSVIATVQRLGRGTRAADGKDSFELWDIHDAGIEMFYKQAQTRMRTYRKRGYEPKLFDRVPFGADQ